MELTQIVLIMKGTTPVLVPLAISGMERHVKVQCLIHVCLAVMYIHMCIYVVATAYNMNTTGLFKTSYLHILHVFCRCQ